MDYDIKVSSLETKSSELETHKSSAEDIYNEFNSCYLSSINDPELSSIKTGLKAPVERLKKGFTNSNTWLKNYLTELNALEDGLAGFSASGLTAPTEFKGEFVDMFGKKTMPIIKTGGDIHANAQGYRSNEDIKYSVEIPDSVNQAGYTVTCYGPGGWHMGGSAKATPVARGTMQKKVHDAWVADGARYKNGIAVMKVNGVDHYLIATAPTFGKVGDSVTVNLKNGESVPCIIADAKSTHDSNYTKWGHGRSNGSVNVLEFEVDRNKYKSSGNPTTSKWGLEWDSSSGVKSIDNHGSVV